MEFNKGQKVVFNGDNPQLPKESILNVEGYWKDVVGKSWIYTSEV